VDISHEVSRSRSWPRGRTPSRRRTDYFPTKTVHVVVVDPGVGTARRPILMEAAGQYFVAPDNGVLSMIYGREEAQDPI
jgi:S-adenosylmethionine hydrolase